MSRFASFTRQNQPVPAPLQQVVAEGVVVNIERVGWRRSRYVMRLRPDGTVAALVPPRWSDKDITDMLHRHRRWLKKRALDAAAKQAAKAEKLPPSKASPLPVSWYKRAAALTLPVRVAHFARVMKLDPRLVKISSGKRHWGLCNTRREISLSYRLILVPPELADYVIIHELAHLVHMNHGKRFWALVEKYVPDYVTKRRTLNKLGGTLD
ncbi:MAG TPA: YgjP-like metallopeptidase domain-containing protein [Alphaproteobacteria bacterium]|nr:YgjP-like metallopeptidase domain-containing protein [Alphaproteobacteria bacterium]